MIDNTAPSSAELSLPLSIVPPKHNTISYFGVCVKLFFPIPHLSPSNSQNSLNNGVFALSTIYKNRYNKPSTTFP